MYRDHERLKRNKFQINVECRIYNTTKIESATINSLYRLSIYDNVDFETEIKSFNVTDNGYVYFKANLEESKCKFCC